MTQEQVRFVMERIYKKKKNNYRGGEVSGDSYRPFGYRSSSSRDIELLEFYRRRRIARGL